MDKYDQAGLKLNVTKNIFTLSLDTDLQTTLTKLTGFHDRKELCDQPNRSSLQFQKLNHCSQSSCSNV